MQSTATDSSSSYSTMYCSNECRTSARCIWVSTSLACNDDYDGDDDDNANDGDNNGDAVFCYNAHATVPTLGQPTYLEGSQLDHVRRPCLAKDSDDPCNSISTVRPHALMAALTPQPQRQEHCDPSSSNSCTGGSQWPLVTRQACHDFLPHNSEHTCGHCHQELLSVMAGVCMVKTTCMPSSLHCTASHSDAFCRINPIHLHHSLQNAKAALAHSCAQSACCKIDSPPS